ETQIIDKLGLSRNNAMIGSYEREPRGTDENYWTWFDGNHRPLVDQNGRRGYQQPQMVRTGDGRVVPELREDPNIKRVAFRGDYAIEDGKISTTEPTGQNGSGRIKWTYLNDKIGPNGDWRQEVTSSTDVAANFDLPAAGEPYEGGPAPKPNDRPTPTSPG